MIKKTFNNTSRLAFIKNALDGLLGEMPQGIAEEGIAMVELMLQKNLDYGGSVFRKPEFAPSMDAKAAILVRMGDKASRLRTLLAGKSPHVDESIRETMIDLAAYCILYVVEDESCGGFTESSELAEIPMESLCPQAGPQDNPRADQDDF